LPEQPGIYLFLDKKGSVLYVGKAKNLKKRVSSYFPKSTDLIGKTKLLVGQIHTIKILIVESEIEALLLEASFIKKNTPKFNVSLKDGKAYPLIKITVNQQLPKVFTVRRMDDRAELDRSLYFGPFPNVGEMRMVLKIIRRIFPFISANHVGKRICLYKHLGLCPCPTTLNTDEQKKEYRKNINYIVEFLLGESKKVISELEKERNRYAKQEEFEKAKDIQKKIDAIINVTSPIYKPFEYVKNPNLYKDLRRFELDGLQKILKEYYPAIATIARIECYDISNISGIYAAGSMVVFTNGEKESLSYRRFKIKREQETSKPNDCAMMEEVLQRRMNHTDWPYPELIIVDGGKGQISSVLKVLKKSDLYIPLIGLAKREEIIITSGFKEIRLSKDSPALKLMMRIRNEAHRFAITYHRKLRAKAIF